ncbi:putative ribonuclease H-like domain-containing protein [Tanacetum coccineum]
MWKLRIEQYFQVQDYALWDVIKNGNSFKPAAQTTTNADGSSTTLIPGPVTADEKTQKNNDVKARSMLLMALPNEHLLTFNQYKDAKTLFAAIQTRFGGNDATKKTQKTLLKQMYENFSAPSTESLDSIFNRLQKIVIASEWNTHVVVWRNKPDLDTMSFDDLYNNFKIVEQEVKGTASSSSQNLAFMSSTSSTNEVNTAYGVINQNESQLDNEDLEQIHEDDLEEMDLKWQLALLSMRTRKFFQKLVERLLSMDSRRTINVEEISSKAMLAIDGADEEVPTDMALMAFSDSEVHNDKTCSKTCLKSFETLKTQLDDLRIEFNKSEFNLATYKRGLASVEEQLVFYKKNEVLFCEQLAVLKRDISYKDSEISVLKSELEKLKQEKESNQLKIEKFDNASKSLDKLIGSQIPDKSRKGLGFVSYNVVPPPPTGLFSPPNLDLSNSGLEEFQQPEFEGYGPKTSKSISEDTSNVVRESPDASLVEELVSNDKSQTPRRNQRNWNNQKSQQLGNDFVMYNKVCFVCESFKHVQANCNYHQRERMVSGNNYTRMNYNYSAKKAHLSAHMNIVPRAVLMKTGLRPLNTARPVNTAHPKTTVYSARPMSCFSKSAQSTVKRPYSIKTTLTNKNYSQKVNTAKGSFYTARPKADNTDRPNSTVVNAVRKNQGHPQKEDQGYVDSGCSRHMTGNMYYLLDFKEFDRGYVAFGGGTKGGRITGKGTLKTGKLNFEDVYFVKELQFNLFCVLQMCDKKNSVLFTDTRCFVMSPNFKLAYESQVLLKVPRKSNMYSFDMKNSVPKESLTCLVAKAIFDESMLWHRRLGHVNFKTINKLVKDNLVKGLLVKHFENGQTCVACLKGKQHKASFMSEFYEKKGIKREFSVARTPQQNGVAERRNRTIIKAARTMLADSKLPTTFWAEAVNTACYVQNRVLVVKPHNKTPYELFRGRTPSLSFMKPFGCHVTILNTLDHLGKFDGKSDDGFFVGYSLNSKAFRVYNIRTRKVEENLHVRFLEDKPIIAGDGPKWLFDIDVLTKSMNYVPVVAGTNSNDFVGTKESNGTGHSSKEPGSSQDYILMPLWKDGSLFDSSSKDASNDEPQPSNDAEKKDDEGGIDDQERTENSAQDVNTAGPSINTASTNFNTVSLNINTVSPTVPTAPLESIYADFFGDEC